MAGDRNVDWPTTKVREDDEYAQQPKRPSGDSERIVQAKLASRGRQAVSLSRHREAGSGR